MKKVNFGFSVCMVILMLFLGSFTRMYGQETTTDQKVIITLVNGNVYKGTVIKENTETITIMVDDVGELTIDRSKIRTIETTDLKTQKNIITLRDDKGFAIDYHNSTRFLISPTGYGLKKGQSYYENIGVFFNSFSFGVSDNFTFTVGGEIASLLFGGNTPIFYLSPRFNIPFKEDKGAASIGVIFFTLPEDNFDGIGLASAAVTFGNRNNQITLGFGAGFETENSFNDGVLMFNLGTVLRLSRKISFVSDNFVLTTGGLDDDGENVFVVSAALRIHFNEKGFALNVGLFRPLEDLDSVLALPFFSATFPMR